MGAAPQPAPQPPLPTPQPPSRVHLSSTSTALNLCPPQALPAGLTASSITGGLVVWMWFDFDRVDVHSAIIESKNTHQKSHISHCPILAGIRYDNAWGWGH